MSPAVVELRSPSTLPNPNFKSQSQFDSSFGFPAFSSSGLPGDEQSENFLSSHSHNSSEISFNSASDSQRVVVRSRPRLTKVRKRVASQHARSKVGSSNDFCSSVEASKLESGGFVFGVSSGERKYTDNVQKELDAEMLGNIEFVFGAKQSHRDSSLDDKSVVVRKRVASQHARSKVGSSNDFCSSVEASKLEFGGFVFGVSSGERKYTDNVQKELDAEMLGNIEFVFGAKQSHRDSSLDDKSVVNCGTSVAEDGVKKKIEPKAECERFDNSSSFFTCNLGSLNTNVKSNSEIRNCNEFSEKYVHIDSGNVKLDSEVECGSLHAVNFLFDRKECVSSSSLSSEEGQFADHAEKLTSRGGRTKPESETFTAMNNNVESVSDADTINLAFSINSDEVDKTFGKTGISGRSNIKTVNNKSDDLNIFGTSWFDAAIKVESTVSDSGVRSKEESIAGFQKVEVSNVNYNCKEGSIPKEDHGGDIFIFRSSSIHEPVERTGPNERKLNHKNVRDNAKIDVTAGNLESNTNINMNKFSTERNNLYDSVSRPKTMLFTLPDEMQNLNINDSGNIDGYEKSECSTSTFPETSSSLGGCEKPSSTSNGNLRNTYNYHSEGIVGATDNNTEDDSESSGNSTTELRSDCKFPSAFVGCSSVEPFNFSSGCSVSCDDGSQFTQPPVNDGMQLKKASATCLFSSASLPCQPNDSLFGVPSAAEVEKNDHNISLNASNDLGTSTEFKIPQWDPSSFKENLFSDLNQNTESSVKSKLNKTKRLKKTRGNLKRTSRKDKVLEKDISKINLDSPGSCTPMDFSPYQETMSVDQNSRETPHEFSHPINSFASWTPHFMASSDETRGVFLTQIQGKDGYNGIWKFNGPNDESNGFSIHSCPFEGFDSRNETESSSSKTKQCCSRDFTGVASSEPGVAFNSITDSLECNCRKHLGSKDTTDKSFTFSASPAIQASLSATKRQHRKKNRKKSNCDAFVISPNLDIKYEFSSLPSTSLHSDTSNKLEVEKKFKQGNSVSAAIQETCENWRLRGNEAYKDGDLSKAEDLYTQGIDSVPSNGRLASCLNSLMLCYSNRAATRMSLGKIREAVRDCEVASELEPNFLKVQVRAANCHLLLGEIENASQNFNKCLESRDGICLDRRMVIEAADGLQKAQKVAECTKRSSELMEQGTDDAALSALNLIDEALSVSLYSEKLLEMKAEALFMLQRYEEAIKLCEQSLRFAEKNCIAESATIKTDVSRPQSHSLARLWRWCLIAKAFFYLGKIEAALDMVGKLEQEKLNEKMCRIKILESSFTLANTIRELLRCKNAGNEAFRSGKHIEAVEHYTAALSMKVQSRSFTAICLCNRAAAYQALGQIVDAIADCSLAIALDENYPKAFSRRASLHEMIRDYGQAASDLQKFIFIIENQSDDKVKQSSTPSRSGGSVELKKARRNMPLMEEAAKKEISLDLYHILGVKATDNPSDIKKAYRKAALRHHPDKAGQCLARSDRGYDGRLWKEISQAVYRDADRLFKIIGEAYAVLSDPNKRSQYDLEEDMRKAAKESNKGSSCRRSSDVYGGSPFERSASGRNFRGNWKSWGSSHS